jgi:hypothetical protein
MLKSKFDVLVGDFVCAAHGSQFFGAVHALTNGYVIHELTRAAEVASMVHARIHASYENEVIFKKYVYYAGKIGTIYMMNKKMNGV